MRPESRIGTEIAGYRIEALIGQGGMGEVYLAEHQTLGRMEALKVLSGDLSTDEGFRKRFQREARLAASLRHPNIIPVYSAGESNGSLYLVMPYIRGTDLRRLIDERKQLDPEQTLRILDGVAGALDAAHGEGLVHRDVKPANILIEARDGHVYLTDFGVTRHMDSKTQLTPTGRFMGTLHYVAPEQIEGKSVDARTDIYSLGCVLYECLAGVIPFQRESEGSLLWAHLSESPPRLTDRRPDLPDAINLVIARAMAKRKEDRFDTCQEMMQEARAALLGQAKEPPAAVTPPAGGTTLGTAAPSVGVGPESTLGRGAPATPAAVQTEGREAVVGVVSPPVGTEQVVAPAASVAPPTVDEATLVGESTGDAEVPAAAEAEAEATVAADEVDTLAAPEAEPTVAADEVDTLPAPEAGTVAPPEATVAAEAALGTEETAARPVPSEVATGAAAAAGAAAVAEAAATVVEPVTGDGHQLASEVLTSETQAAPVTSETQAAPATAETAAAPQASAPPAAPPTEETVAAAQSSETAVAKTHAAAAAAAAGLETVAAAPPPPITLQPPAYPGGIGMPATVAEGAIATPPPPTIAEGAPPGAPPPQKPGRGRLVAIIVGAVVVVGAAAGIVLATSGGESGTTPTPPPSVPTTLPTTPSPSTSPTGSPTTSPTKTGGSGPAAPTALHAAAAGTSEITLSWHKVPGAATYQIFVFQAPKPFDHTTATHFTVTGLQPNSKHCYQVVAVGPAGATSGRSGRTCATTKPAVTVTPSSQTPSSSTSSQPPPPPPPATPTGVSASCTASGTCTVHWSESSSNVTSFTVSGGGKSVTVSGSARSATISGLPTGQTICFSVVAHNSSGSSGAGTGCGQTG